MREVAQTVADAGLEPLLSRAIAERQDWAAVRGQAIGADLAPNLAALLDQVDGAADDAALIRPTPSTR